MINPMRSQPTRMMGLASGMDTDFIIQQTLRMHQFKIDNITRNKKLIEWKQQTQNSIKDEITSLRQTFLSNLGAKSMMSRNAFNSTISSVSGANSSAVTVRTNAGSPLGNFSIQSVNQLAKGAHLTTAKGASANGNGFATGTRLSDLDFANGGKISWTHDGATVNVGGTNVKIERSEAGEWSFKEANGESVTGDFTDNKLTITVGDVTRTLNYDPDTLKLTEDVPGMFSANFTDVAVTSGTGDSRNFTITVNMNGDEPVFTSNAGTVSLEDDILRITIGTGDNAVVYTIGDWDKDAQTLNGAALTQNTRDVVTMAGEVNLTFNTGGEDVNIMIRSNDTLSDVMTKINNSAAGVNMSYDRLSDQFTLETRISNSVDPSGTDLRLDTATNFFNLLRGNVSTIASEPVISSGQKAVAYINGERIESNTNNIDYRGVGITLNSTFNAAYNGVGTEPTDTVNVSLTRDTDRAFNAIKDFIDSYNSIIRKLENLLTERKGRNEIGYKPLTDEEKQGMTDKQIDEWEAIARKGILRNDQGIQSLVNNLRSSFFTEIEGMGISPSSIGLSTGSYFDGTGGQIMINEERLREAIERDPDMVADVFIKFDTSDGGARPVGLLHKIDGLMRDFVNTTQSTSIKNLEDSLKRTNEQIERMQARMFAEEDKLYRQFAAMESAMQKLNQQGGWFSAMLGNG